MLRFLALALLAALAAPHTASALESAAATSPHGSATLVSEADSFKPGQPLRLGLHLHIAPGWHTYWLNPGDAGAPPTIDITGATAGPIAYPTPQREQDGPFTSFVYLNEVTLPFTVTPPPGAAGPLHLTAHATWLVCEKICVPEEASFALALPPGNAAPGANAGLFRDADAATPRPSPFPAQVAADGTLRLEAPGVRPVSLYVFPDEAGVIDQALPQSFTTDAGGLSVHLKPLAKTGFTKPFAGVMTLTDQAGRTEALHVAATPTTALPAGGTAAPAMPHLADALLLAFLGGLVLNLMPCVLPVLAMKALAMARLSGAARGRIRHESLLYTAGVLVAFGAIGGITLAVGAAGGAAGWGVQFQSAAFSAGMALLMLAVALNFSGVYEFGAGAAGFGQSLAQRGSFFTGLLAVVVATPCTAPFMATALAAAVALPARRRHGDLFGLGVGARGALCGAGDFPRHGPLAASAPAPGWNGCAMCWPCRCMPRPPSWPGWCGMPPAIPGFSPCWAPVRCWPWPQLLTAATSKAAPRPPCAPVASGRWPWPP